DKRLVLLPLMVLTITLVVGCVPKKEGDKKLSATTKAVTQVSTQEMKTYVSKYGFSVSYPNDWVLEENWHTTNIPEDKKGWLSFDLGSENENVDMFFETQKDLSSSPNTLKDKLSYFAKKENVVMNTIQDYKMIDKGENVFGLAYGQPRGIFEKYNVLIFYLPQTRSVASIIFYNQGKYSVEEIMNKVYIKILK
ncbi:MAG: PsbP-related protein, partial [Candidatus Margulisiibacteriota bacterium]